MNSASAKKPLDLLFVGPSRLVENIQSAIPNHWHARFVESFEEFFKNPEDVTRILDASIREVLDLGVKEFRLVRHVACASTGTNHIKHRLNDEEPVKVSSLRDIPDVLNTLTAAAEFSFGLLISLARNIVHSSKSVESGEWNRSMFGGAVLRGKNLGIIGLGRIGSAMEMYGKAFGMNVGYFDPFVKVSQVGTLKYERIEDLLIQSDFVSLHVPYVPKTQKQPLITKEHFSLFKAGSFFINTSRGELVEEEGLVWALEIGKIRGAAVDVLNNEPNIFKNPLFLYSLRPDSNVIITPQIAGYATENLEIATSGILSYLLSDKMV